MSIARLDGGITESHGDPLAASSSSSSTSHHLRNGGDFRFPGKNSRTSTRGADRTPINTASHALGSRIAEHLCAPEKNLSSGPHRSHPLLLSHLPFTTSTSSSSFTLPCTTTQEHAQQSGQHDPLQEHPVHHESPQDRPVGKQRHQESLWRENRQSGGNPRTTFSTGCEPKEPATVSKISRAIDPYQFFDVQKEFGEQGHQAPITEEVKEIGEIGTHGLPDSKISETSYFQSHVHFDDSVESTADSDLEDGELQKMLTSTLCAEKAGNPRQLSCRRER